jgi:hypothetical protein
VTAGNAGLLKQIGSVVIGPNVFSHGTPRQTRDAAKGVKLIMHAIRVLF